MAIAVRDDGAGFDVDAPTRGFGLTVMRKRFSLAGRRLEIMSSGQVTLLRGVVANKDAYRCSASEQSHAGATARARGRRSVDG